MSLRVRLALAYTLLIGVTLFLVGATTNRLLRHGLLTEVGRDVQRRAATFAATQASPPYPLDVFRAPDVFLQVVDDRGHPVASSGNLGDRVLPLSADARAGKVVEEHVGGRPLYLTAAPIDGGRFIIVARSPITIYAALRELRGTLNFILPAAVAAALIVSWGVAAAALRPIERIVATATSVKERRDLKQRVANAGRKDEVGRLAASFNAMLAELETAYRDLDEANQRLRRFATDSAHELRAPLTLILGNLDVLSRVAGTDPGFASQAIAEVRAEAQRMARMITQLLILGRADAGVPMTSSPVAIRDIVAEAGRQGEAMANGVRFEWSAAIPEDRQVLGNADYLRQLFVILVDNALKFTPADGAVRMEASVADGSVRIVVRDSGAGVHPEDLPRVFDRFYRGRNANAVPGTGLGLSIARWVAEQHGGRIWLEDAATGGTTATVELPLIRNP